MMTPPSAIPIKQEQLENTICLSSSSQSNPRLTPIEQEPLENNPHLSSSHQSDSYLTLNIKSKNQTQVFESGLCKLYWHISLRVTTTNWMEVKMSDTDDSGPLSQQAKRRRTVSSTTATAKHRKDMASKTVGGDHQAPSHMFSSKEELDAMRAQFKARILTQQKLIRDQDFDEEQKIERMRSALDQNDRENQALEERLSRGLADSRTLANELILSRNAYQESKTATDARQQKLAQALADLDSLDNLTKDISVRLHETDFQSKHVSIMNMLEPLHREFFDKYVNAEDIQFSDEVATSSPSTGLVDDIMTNRLLLILSELRGHKFWYIFAEPVTETIAPQYFQFIEQPMDLSTMKQKLKSKQYETLADFLGDAHLIFDNCRRYNRKQKFYVQAANSVEDRLVELLEKGGFRRM